MTSLLDFCHEILHDIIVEVYPEDLAALSASCRTLNKYINGNRLLWRDVYLKHFDAPSEKAVAKAGNEFWEGELKRYVRLQKLLQGSNDVLKRAELIPASQTICDIITRANPHICDSLNQSFLLNYLSVTQSNFSNLAVFLFSSSLYERCGSDDTQPHEDEEGRQLSAKLHCLYGTSAEDRGRTRSHVAHPHARSRVYDLRNYTDKTKWGPFRADGSMRVDWEKVEALMIDLAHNMEMYAARSPGAIENLWERPFEGVTPNSYFPLDAEWDGHAPYEQIFRRFPFAEDVNNNGSTFLLPQPEPPLEAMDPYGVTGMWRRIVCFLDYSDFYAFNFADPDPEPEGPQPFGASRPLSATEPRRPITTQEAIRLIIMKVRVTKLEKPGEDDGKELPVVHFAGSSRSMHSAWDPNANSRLKGTVRLNKEGEVRWTTLSIFHGEARWRSEGIQVGGLRSARGVIGTWFDKDYDIHGPAGPTAFWKLTDALESPIRKRPLPREFQ